MEPNLSSEIDHVRELSVTIVYLVHITGEEVVLRTQATKVGKVIGFADCQVVRVTANKPEVVVEGRHVKYLPMGQFRVWHGQMYMNSCTCLSQCSSAENAVPQITGCCAICDAPRTE